MSRVETESGVETSRILLRATMDTCAHEMHKHTSKQVILTLYKYFVNVCVLAGKATRNHQQLNDAFQATTTGSTTQM